MVPLAVVHVPVYPGERLILQDQVCEVSKESWVETVPLILKRNTTRTRSVMGHYNTSLAPVLFEGAANEVNGMEVACHGHFGCKWSTEALL